MECFVGFDAFIDQIIEPVYKREKEKVVPFPSMLKFSEMIGKASGKSCNIELIVQEEKIGGNGPNLAVVLVNLGHQVTIAGNFGKKQTFPIFNPLLQKCQEVFSYEDPGLTDALEFTDGKIILGKHRPLLNLNHLDVIHAIGEAHFLEILEKAALFVSANWTMLPMTNALWHYIEEKIAPKLSKKTRYMFVDLADPAKRGNAELNEALERLKALNQTFNVTLSLNLAEADQVARLLQVDSDARALRQKLNLFCVIVHSSKESQAAKEHEFASHMPHFIANPKIKTGAGDNFGAGFCHAWLQNRSLHEALAIANGTASLYIQEGKSPNREELAIFLQECDNISL